MATLKEQFFVSMTIDWLQFLHQCFTGRITKVLDNNISSFNLLFLAFFGKVHTSQSIQDTTPLIAVIDKSSPSVSCPNQYIITAIQMQHLSITELNSTANSRKELNELRSEVEQLRHKLNRLEMQNLTQGRQGTSIAVKYLPITIHIFA